MRDWSRQRKVIPLASLLPAAAIVYAFSLGPSPLKVLALYESSPTVEDARRVLAHPPHGLEAAMVERVAWPSAPYRELTVAFLGERRFRGAIPVLESIVVAHDEPQALRAAALEALVRIDPERGRENAALQISRDDALGVFAAGLLIEAPL